MTTWYHLAEALIRRGEDETGERRLPDVNGIKVYHEIYGLGQPLVLIHGGLTTIGTMQGWLQPLERRGK